MVATEHLIVNSQNAQQSAQFGEILGQLLNDNHIICLEGDLGAGKTTFVRGVGRGWKTTDRVTSPTFTVMNIYRRPTDAQRLFHLDAYRLETEASIESIGLDDIFAASGPVLIEWPQQIHVVLPSAYLWIAFDWTDDDDDHRQLTFTSYGTIHAELLRHFAERINNAL